MKKVSKLLNGSTNRLVEKSSFTFQKCENNWSLKSDFASSQHSALKIKGDCTKGWNERCHTENGSSSPTFWPLSLSTGAALSEPPAKKNRKVIIDKLSPTTLSSKFMKIQTLFHKTDPTRTLNGLRFTKPWKIKLTGVNTRLHAWPQASEITDSSFKSMEICSKFQKTDHTRVFHGLKCTKPENFRPKNIDTHSHAPQ